jgi:small-conductance mechanosensitive channel
MSPLTASLSKILAARLAGIPVREYAICLAAILIGCLLVKVFQILVSKRLKQWFIATPTTWDDLLVDQFEKNGAPILYVVVVYMGLKDLEMKDFLLSWLRTGTAAAVTVLAVRVLLAVVDHAIKTYWRRHATERSEDRERSLHGITTIAKLVVWIIGAILLLDNLGIKVSAFVAGLGITGIAVALAAQAILGDLFSYFVIFFDQPFEVGHVIKVDQFTGEVERIGLKTTRLRSVDGEQIVVSNKFLTDSRVQNFKRMVRRRVVFAFEVEYETGEAALKAIPEMVKASLARFPDVTFDRAHLKEFTNFGLKFETAYYVETPDFRRYLDVQQEVNLALLSDFKKGKIEFAFPAGVVHVHQDPPPDSRRVQS